MFLQVSVCPQGGGMHGCKRGGVRGCSVGWVHGMRYGRSLHGQYASYWNAFLFYVNFTSFEDLVRGTPGKHNQNKNALE